jgi:DNA polymerase III subunit beta
MKLICERSALLEAVLALSSVAAARTPKEVLRCIKMTAGDGVLTLTSTDLEIALQFAITQVDIQDPGETVILADKLLQILRESADQTVTIETDGNDSHIRGADSHFKVLGFPAGEFPPIPDFPADDQITMELSAGDLHQLIVRTVFATARENSRYAINGVLLVKTGKQLELVATDGRRLALARGSCKSGKNAADESRCIIPTKALNVLTKLVHEAEANVQVAITENQVLFRFAEAAGVSSMLSTKTVEGTFPPYEDVIPRDQDKKVVFACDELASAVRRAALLTNEESRGVRLSFKEDLLTLSSRAPELGEAEIKLPMAGYEGEEIEIGFNPAFITDALKVIHTQEVQIEMKASTKPGIIRSGSDFLCVIMPVNLQ